MILSQLWFIFIKVSIIFNNISHNNKRYYRLCGLVVRVSGYRSRGPGSIPGTTTFSEKQWVWNGVLSASLSTIEEQLRKKKVAVPV
jgi:hypothetical protein